MKTSGAISSTLIIPVLHSIVVSSFQFPHLSFRFIQATNQIKQQQQQHIGSTLPSRRNRDEFTNDGSPRGFGKSKASSRPLNRNGKQRNITSVKDVDPALNDEIEGALMSVEMDFKKESGIDIGEKNNQEDEDVSVASTTPLPVEVSSTQSSSSWDNLKETVYDAVDSTKAKMNPPSFAADYTPVPPETPGEKVMKEFSAIDVNVVQDSFAEADQSDDEMSPEEKMLLVAQKEAEEAEALLHEAEMESDRLEKELAALESPISSNPNTKVDTSEEDALTSMASAYEAALDAANDNVNLLTSQIEELEGDLSTALRRMEDAIEDKERVSAEYSYLASNYRGYKDKMDGEDKELRNKMEGFSSQVESLEEKIRQLKSELVVAQEEAMKWKTEYDSIQRETTSQLESSFKDQEELQALLDDTTSTFESTQTEFAAVTAEYDLALDQSKKMISALRASLRKTRSEQKSQTTSEEVERAVDDVRTKMNDEVEKLRGALKGLEGQAGENDDIVRREREDRERLLEEIEMLKKSIEEEQSKSAASSEEYSLTLEVYTKKEDELNAMIQSKNEDIDALTVQVDAMKLEIESLESGGGNVDELSAVNAKLTSELEGARALLQDEKSALSSTKQKVAALEQELTTKQNLASATEIALKETKANLNAFKEQYVNEQKSAEKLLSELKAAEVKLVEMELSAKSFATEQVAISAKEKKELDAKISELTSRLKAAVDEANESKQGMKIYAEELQQLSSQFTQFKSNKEALEQSLDATGAKLNASNAIVEQLQAELKSTQAKLVDMELSSKSTASERDLAAEKERSELRYQIEQLGSQLKMASERANSGEEKIKLYEERVQNITGQLNQSESNIEKLKQELESTKEVATKQLDKNQELLSQIDALKQEMSDSSNRANAEIKKRNDALKNKQILEAELEARINQLLKDMSNARASVDTKTQEAQSLQDLVEKLKSDLTKEAQLREEVAESKKGLESLLQKKVSEWQEEMAHVRIEAEKEVARLKDDMVKVATEREEISKIKVELERTFKSEISKLQIEIGDVKSKAGATIAAKDNAMKKMEATIAQLKVDVDHQRKLADEALKGKADLNAAMQKKMDQLQANASTTDQNTNALVQAKEKEMADLNNLITELRSEIKAETHLKNEAMKSQESAESSLKSKIDQLLGDISSSRAKSEEAIRSKDLAMKEKDTLISTLKADLSTLLQVKDNALNERDRLEKELTSQVLELKNSLGQTRLKADSMVANESKLKDDAVTANAELTKNVNALEVLVANLRAKIDTTTKEKNHLETKLQVNIKQAQTTDGELNKMNEVAANLKNELQQQTAKLKQMEAASSKAATSQVEVHSVALPKSKQSQETNAESFGRGFAKKSQQTSQSGQGFAKDSKKFAPESSTPEQVEAERKARLQSAEEARKLNESKRVTAALDQLAKSSSKGQDTPKQQSKEKQSAKVSVGIKPKYVRVESDQPLQKVASLKDLLKGQEMRGQPSFPQRKEAPSPSTQAPSQPSNQEIPKAASLKTIVAKDNSNPKQAFPKRKQAPAPSSQAASSSVRYQKISQQSSSLKNVAAKTNSPTSNPFPDRKNSPPPSSQAPTVTQAEDESETGPSLKTMVAKDTAMSTNAFPERKKSPAPSSQAPLPKQSASGDHEREGLTLRRYTQTRKASTSLGGLANSSGDQAQPTLVQTVDNQADDQEPPAVRKKLSFANLASLVSNGDVINRDRSTVNQARSAGTKLGDIAKNPAAHREVIRTATVAATKSPEKEVVQVKVAESESEASVDPQEAFQRALLTSRLANSKIMHSDNKMLPLQEANNSDIPSSTGFSSLSAIIQVRDRRLITPTINKDRSKNSLFPDKSGSVLSRLLNK